MNELRPYQRIMLDALARDIDQGKRGMYAVLPTGCGKTRVGAELIGEMLPHRSLWVVHTRELVHQAADAIRANLENFRFQMGAITRRPTVGVVMADNDECEADVVVGSIQTLRSERRLASLRRISGVCIIDECHHVTKDNTYADLAHYVQDEWKTPVVGLTATPFRGDNKAMQDMLPHCSFERSIADMIREGWLCDLVYRQVTIEGLDLSDVRMVRKLGEADFNERDLAPKVESYDVIAQTVRETAPIIKQRGVPSLAFCTSVAHAQQMANAYRSQGLRSHAVWGAQPKDERDSVLKMWRAGAIDVVTNCAVLTEGFDFPQIGTLVIARPTTSVALYTQMVGRGTRIVDGKSECMILDITGRMPARAVRVSLDDLVGENLSEESENGEITLERKRLNAARPRVHALRDPYGRARFAWTQHPLVAGVWFTPIADGIRAVLLPAPTGVGLYRAFLWRRDMPSLQQAGAEFVPRRQAIADMEASLARARITSKALSYRNKKWRDELPTGKQLQLLARRHPALHRAAVAEKWSKGDVSLAIDAIEITQRVANEIARQKKEMLCGSD